MSSSPDKSTLKREIRRAVLRPFELAGWSKAKKGAVYKAGDGVPGVVVVETSPLGHASHALIGYWFPENAEERIQHYKCPIYFPIHRFYPEKTELVLTALDYEASSLEIIGRLGEFVADTVVDEVSGLVSKDALREVLSGDRLSAARVLLTAREALGI